MFCSTSPTVNWMFLVKHLSVKRRQVSLSVMYTANNDLAALQASHTLFRPKTPPASDYCRHIVGGGRIPLGNSKSPWKSGSVKNLASWFSWELLKLLPPCRCQVLRLKCTEFDFGCADPAGEAYNLRGPTSRGREKGKGNGRGEKGKMDGRFHRLFWFPRCRVSE